MIYDTKKIYLGLALCILICEIINMIQIRLYRNGGYEDKVSHVGSTLYTYERNGYHDSDWYAVVYDAGTDSLQHVEFATTRFNCDGCFAKVDALPEIAEAAHKLMTEENFKALVEREKANRQQVQISSKVKVVKGRTAKGNVGFVFWIGARQRFGGKEVRKIGIRYSDKMVDGKWVDVDFVYMHNVEVAGWEKDLPLVYLHKVANSQARDALGSLLSEEYRQQQVDSYESLVESELVS